MNEPGLRVDQDGRRVIARLAGEIDLASRSGLERALLRAAGGGPLVVDLGAVTYVDSAGVYLLERVAALLAARGHDLTVVAPPGSVAGDVLAIAGVDGRVRVVAHPDEL